MDTFKSNKSTAFKGDPSRIPQSFSSFNLQLLCCRYWWLEHWEFDELSFPYWRIYHNINDIASIDFNNKTYPLTEDKIVVIAPHTAYSTRILDYPIPQEGVAFRGQKITKNYSLEKIKSEKKVLHLFIHFNLGTIVDKVKPGIFLIDVNDFYLAKLTKIKDQLLSSDPEVNFETTLLIKSFILELLTNIPSYEWEWPSKDNRILDSIVFIEKNLSKQLSNEILASRIDIAPNSFNRLFTNVMGISPQRFIKKCRIDKACILLHHSQDSIEEVAYQCGFADRYHFSRVFKKLTNISPAKYRRDFII